MMLAVRTNRCSDTPGVSDITMLTAIHARKQRCTGVHRVFRAGTLPWTDSAIAASASNPNVM